jgi:DNA-directed RNA polymerase subunit M/transcription elongation factor TFIIS
MYYNQFSEKPCAYITKGKQRIKQFGQNVYLKDGSEFEVELYNPTRKTVLSKIKINGEFIKGGGIILRPGERIFLERYIDVPRKFKFETYTVDSTNETMNAIASNGDVEILFYEEQEVPNLKLTSYPAWNPTFINTNGTFTTTNGSDTIIGNNFYTTSVNYSSTNVGDINLTNLTNTSNINNDIRSSKYISKYDQQSRSRSFAKKSKSVETGRVEQGSSSNQSFKTVSKEFNAWAVSTSVWKLLPESQKPIEKKDLIEKCPRCSTKLKKQSWKFCPECGNELVRTKTEIIYTNNIMVIHNEKHYAMSSYRMELNEFFEVHKNKLIYLKTDSIGTGEIRAIVID